MRRDERLVKLSREHYGALKLALLLSKTSGRNLPDELAFKFAVSRQSLLEHFREEENNLLPDLLAHSEFQMANRLRDDHHRLELLSSDINNIDAIKAFAQLLVEHVRFEEREMFQALQNHWRRATDLPQNL